ncbi:FYN-binding protein 2 isoform X2 [Dromaius novaehollandiae]|uniref:FYN-binding protein 2 isoform X2 n=1 Tax=Dromaius novaehollandiae TaxID=8790 RepID=UPI00311F1CC5
MRPVKRDHTEESAPSFPRGAQEGVTDFRALRAKFQNDANFSKQLVQPPKKLVLPPTDAMHKLGPEIKDASSSLSFNMREVIILKAKNEPFPPTSQPSALVQGKPLVQPRARLGKADPRGKNEEQKGNLLEEGVNFSKNSSQKPQPPYCTDQQESARTDPEAAPSRSSFQLALQMWESALSQSEKAGAALPPQRRTNIYVQPCPELRATGAPAVPDGGKMRTARSEQALDFPAQQKDALRGGGLAASQAPSMPRLPRRCRSSDQLAAESTAATSFCQPGYDVQLPREFPQCQKESEPPFYESGAGKASDTRRSKLPKIKPLPSVESLGPAPAKPARPLKVDLGAFQSTVPSVRRGNERTAAEEDYLTPESAELEEQHNYEDTTLYLNQPGDSATLSASQAPEREPPEHDKKQKSFLFAKSSPAREVEDENEEKPSLEREKQQAKKIFKTGGSDYVTHRAQPKEDGRGGKKVPQVKQGDVPKAQAMKHATLQGLAKDGAERLRYMHVGAPKPAEEGTALSQDTGQPLQSSEELYDDVEGLQSRLHASEASSSLAPDSISGNYEETYDDVEPGGDNPAKVEAEKQKRFGSMFKIEKFKLKHTRFKENFRLSSSSVPNLAALSQEDTYDDVETGQTEPREKEDKHRTWKPRFLMSKEDKDRRKSSEDVERSIFKVNKGSAEKSKKMSKEEKLFRETFMYNKEISVINTAVAQCSVPSKRRVDLPVTAGEQLDVIDTTEGNEVICRNAEGRYGYVLVEHLNFRHYCLPPAPVSSRGASLDLDPWSTA